MGFQEFSLDCTQQAKILRSYRMVDTGKSSGWIFLDKNIHIKIHIITQLTNELGIFLGIFYESVCPAFTTKTYPPKYSWFLFLFSMYTIPNFIRRWEWTWLCYCLVWHEYGTGVKVHLSSLHYPLGYKPHHHYSQPSEGFLRIIYQVMLQTRT